MKKKRKKLLKEYLESTNKSLSLIVQIRECDKEIKRLKRLTKVFFEEE